MNTIILNKALRAYHAAGLSVIPTNRQKRPAGHLLPQAVNAQGQPLYWDKAPDGRSCTTTKVTDSPKGEWGTFQSTIPAPSWIEKWIASTAPGIACIGGRVSGNVECIDFDDCPDAATPTTGREAYALWAALPEVAAIMARHPFAVQITGSGRGIQLAYRSAEPVEGNQKLASLPDANQQSLVIKGKALIETRGEGGYFLLPPSIHPSGGVYERVAGAFTKLPVITGAERQTLLDAARSLDRMPTAESEPKPARAPRSAPVIEGEYNNVTVIEAYNRQHGITATLERYGYTHAHGDRWSRPGKTDSAGVAVLDDNTAYAHSSNDAMYYGRDGKNQPFSPFDLFLHHEHGDDMKAAIRAAAIELGIQYRLHTVIWVDGLDNAAIVAPLMFPHGWVTRPIGRVAKVQDIEQFTARIVWAETKSRAQAYKMTIPDAYTLTMTPEINPATLAADGLLVDFLRAARADALGIEMDTPDDKPLPADNIVDFATEIAGADLTTESDLDAGQRILIPDDFCRYDLPLAEALRYHKSITPCFYSAVKKCGDAYCVEGPSLGVMDYQIDSYHPAEPEDRPCWPTLVEWQKNQPAPDVPLLIVEGSDVEYVRR